MTTRASTRTSGGDVFVTWGMLDRVLSLALEPITEKLDAVHVDVRMLIDDKSARSGAADERRRWLDSRRFVVTTMIALAVGLIGSVATLVWLAAG